jgi:spermidine/putrescine transport system ATP-binding protein
MEKVYTVNKYDGVITKNNTVKFGDGEYECDITQLYKGSHIDEEGYLITAQGEKLDLTGVEVDVEVDTNAIAMSDDLNGDTAQGRIISMIYKGDHYRYIVRTEENEEDYVFSCPDLWNTGDLVSLVIAPENIKLKLKPTTEEDNKR